jgi:hypothetical protein
MKDCRSVLHQCEPVLGLTDWPVFRLVSHAALTQSRYGSSVKSPPPLSLQRRHLKIRISCLWSQQSRNILIKKILMKMLACRFVNV